MRARGESEKAFTQGSCFAMRRELLEWVLPLPDAYPFHDIWIADLAHDLEAVVHIGDTHFSSLGGTELTHLPRDHAVHRRSGPNSQTLSGRHAKTPVPRWPGRPRAMMTHAHRKIESGLDGVAGGGTGNPGAATPVKI